MSKLIDIVANTMKLALVDKVVLLKEDNRYSIYSKHDLNYIGELEESSGLCYFNYYNHRMDTPKIHALVTLIKKFLSNNFKPVKLDITIDDHVYYRITEKYYVN